MSNEINNLMEFDGFRLNMRRKTLRFADESVDLPLKAIEVLCVLVENSGRLVTKDEIFDRVWNDSFVEESVLTQNIYRLRKAFEKYGIEKDLIKNIPRRGYRFLGEVREITETEEFSIERETFERQFIAERIISEEDSFERNRQENQARQIPSSKSRFFTNNNIFLTVTTSVLSFFMIGAVFWFWQSKENNSSKIRVLTDKIEFTRITNSGKAFYPAISRDNRNIAYVRLENNTSSIILQNASTRSETVIVEPKPFEIRSLNFSADGNYLYYITREKDNPESTVYQVPIFGGTNRKIITNVRHYFSISPDGKQLAFFRYNPSENEYYLMTCQTDGNSERIIATRKPPDFFQDWGTYPAWSPDGRKFVVSAHTQISGQDKNINRSYFIEIDIETGKEKRLSHPDWETAYQAFWLKDASGLIVSARERSKKFAQLWHLSYPNGTAAKITNDTNNYSEFNLASDSNSIIASETIGGANLFTVSAEDPQQVRQITSQALASYGRHGIAWTLNGAELVYVKTEERSDGNLWKINLETLDDQQLTFDKNIINVYPKITPDGNSVLFQSNRTGNWHIWQIDLDGKNLKQITNGVEGQMGHDISADGKWLFYHSPGRGPTALWKMPLAGGKPVKILQNAAGVVAVSPIDPDEIVSSFYDPDEKENYPWKYVFFSEQAKENLKDLKFEPENHSVRWKPDGTGVYFARKEMNHNNLWFVSVDDGVFKQITDFSDQKIVNLAVSPDGQTIALSRSAGTSNILRINGFNQPEN